MILLPSSPPVLAIVDVGIVAAVLIPFLFKLAGAIALWIVGGWLINLSMKLLRRTFTRSHLDPTLITYLLTILGAILRVVLVVAILGFFGIQTASFAALLAGAGVFLQIFRPINVGDYVDVLAQAGFPVPRIPVSTQGTSAN
jgi:small conductance mechanosensitive channel